MVNDVGQEEFGKQVEVEWKSIKEGVLKLEQKDIDYAKSFFTSPTYDNLAADDNSFTEAKKSNKDFSNWTNRNLYAHKISGYQAVIISLKAPSVAPGDATDEQMDNIADLSDQYSFSEIIVTHDQNLVLPHVKQGDLFLSLIHI